MFSSGKRKKRTAAGEVERLRQSESTFAKPIVFDGSRKSGGESLQYREFVANFDSTFPERERGGELASLLKKYYSTLGKHYKQLVLKTKAVSKKDFWLRYYYRCDEKRIQRILDGGKSEVRKFGRKSSFRKLFGRKGKRSRRASESDLGLVSDLSTSITRSRSMEFSRVQDPDELSVDSMAMSLPGAIYMEPKDKGKDYLGLDNNTDKCPEDMSISCGKDGAADASFTTATASLDFEETVRDDSDESVNNTFEGEANSSSPPESSGLQQAKPQTEVVVEVEAKVIAEVPEDVPTEAAAKVVVEKSLKMKQEVVKESVEAETIAKEEVVAEEPVEADAVAKEEVVAEEPLESDAVAKEEVVVEEHLEVDSVAKEEFVVEEPLEVDAIAKEELVAKEPQEEDAIPKEEVMAEESQEENAVSKAEVVAEEPQETGAVVKDEVVAEGLLETNAAAKEEIVEEPLEAMKTDLDILKYSEEKNAATMADALGHVKPPKEVTAAADEDVAKRSDVGVEIMLAEEEGKVESESTTRIVEIVLEPSQTDEHERKCMQEASQDEAEVPMEVDVPTEKGDAVVELSTESAAATEEAVEAMASSREVAMSEVKSVVEDNEPKAEPSMFESVRKFMTTVNAMSHAPNVALGIGVASALTLVVICLSRYQKNTK